MPRKTARPLAVRCTCQSMRWRVAPSTKTPCSASALDRRSGAATTGTDFRHRHQQHDGQHDQPQRRLHHRTAGHRQQRRRRSSPRRAAPAAAKRRLARPLRISIRTADNALASATSRPAPRTKSRWKGKNPPTMGTNSVPPPMPAGTATMPSRSRRRKSATPTSPAEWPRPRRPAAARAGPAEQQRGGSEARASRHRLVVEVLRVVGLRRRTSARPAGGTAPPGQQQHRRRRRRTSANQQHRQREAGGERKNHFSVRTRPLVVEKLARVERAAHEARDRWGSAGGAIPMALCSVERGRRRALRRTRAQPISAARSARRPAPPGATGAAGACTGAPSANRERRARRRSPSSR